MKFCAEVANMWYEPLWEGFCEGRKIEFSLEYQGFQRLPKKRADSVLWSPNHLHYTQKWIYLRDGEGFEVQLFKSVLLVF